MNHKIVTTAIMPAMVALVLTSAAFTVPTLQAQAWGLFGNGIKLDQLINQLNKCKSLSSKGTYDPTSYDVNTSNQPTTESSHSSTNNNHTSTDSSSNHASAGNQTSTASIGHDTNSGWYSNNNKNSNDAGNDNNKPSDNNGGYNDNNNKKPSSSSVLCSNKGTNLATIG